MKKTLILSLGFFGFAGLLLLGIFINKGLQSFSNKERVVTVRGLAEKDIKAIGATISISTSLSSDFPNELLVSIDKKSAQIEAFLKEKGYTNLTVNDVEMYDSGTYYDTEWDGEKRVKVKKDRYRASKVIVITIKEVEKADKQRREIDLALIQKELSCNVSCSYKFPELNSIKPALIAESTVNARQAGEQFAKDSQSKLGKIKTASQGQISIAGSYYSDEDGESSSSTESYIERVRVVSSIVFFLED
jgi:hypothetical protein